LLLSNNGVDFKKLNPMINKRSPPITIIPVLSSLDSFKQLLF